MGIQGGCTCQPFLLNSIFGTLGAYGGHHHHSLECCSHSEPRKAPQQRKKANGWGGMWRGVIGPKMHINFCLAINPLHS